MTTDARPVARDAPAAIFDRSAFFDAVRHDPFPGSLDQSQVDGMNFILDRWERDYPNADLRHLAYPLATTYHECSGTMQPIEEYGKGSTAAYGKPDPETGQAYYGRGFLQLTWRDNYARADQELGYDKDTGCEWHAEKALEDDFAAQVLFIGMIEGWFRSDDAGAQNLSRYFNASTDNPFGAREIINGDKNQVPSWSDGVSVGQLIAGYHAGFLAALQASRLPAPGPPPDVVETGVTLTLRLTLRASGPVTVSKVTVIEAAPDD